ncbi:hypothetical protein TNCT_303941 [Trichonephila clavata]|uniref:Uncharacterized protein n=1 Tax=Trichonephila clavata TaxID=2740835 RepID=A0A8X6L7H0_TRICU|nr:hypothetical protein TNCT_303941 [Trichonephila clavata]
MREEYVTLCAYVMDLINLSNWSKDRVPVKNPNRLTEDEIRAMVQAICDEPEDENEVGRSDTSDDGAYTGNDTESEQELSVEIKEEIEKESEITDEYFLGKDKTTTWNKNPLTNKYTKISKKNIVKIFPGLKSCAKYITDKKKCF